MKHEELKFILSIPQCSTCCFVFVTKVTNFQLMHFFLFCGADAFPSHRVICSGCS
jgi:hypothetical protein